MKHVVYRTKDGRVLRTAPAPDSRLMLFDAEGDIRGERWETDREMAERVAATLPPGTPYRIIDESQPIEAAGFSASSDQLEEHRAAAVSAIDAAAEAARRRFVTPGDGMALVYEAKRSEAEKWIGMSKGGDPDAAAFPLLSAEARRTGETVAAVAREWKIRSDAWMIAAGMIETLRLDGKAQLAACADVAGVDAVRQRVVAALREVGA